MNEWKKGQWVDRAMVLALGLMVGIIIGFLNYNVGLR